MELMGRVLWWSEKNENGVIVDLNGNEFYFDRSVLKLKPQQKIERKSVVTFEHNTLIHDCLCANKVQLTSASKNKTIERHLKNRLPTNLLEQEK